MPGLLNRYCSVRPTTYATLEPDLMWEGARPRCQWISQHMGVLTNRYRGQAPSHIWISSNLRPYLALQPRPIKSSVATQ